MTVTTNPAHSRTSPESAHSLTCPVRAGAPVSLKHETTVSSHPIPYSLFPVPYSLFPAFVFQITVSTNSPIFGVQSHEINQHHRFFICMWKCLFHQIQCKKTANQTISLAGIN